MRSYPCMVIFVLYIRAIASWPVLRVIKAAILISRGVNSPQNTAIRSEIETRREPRLPQIGFGFTPDCLAWRPPRDHFGRLVAGGLVFARGWGQGQLKAFFPFGETPLLQLGSGLGAGL